MCLIAHVKETPKKKLSKLTNTKKVTIIKLTLTFKFAFFSQEAPGEILTQSHWSFKKPSSSGPSGRPNNN